MLRSGGGALLLYGLSTISTNPAWKSNIILGLCWNALRNFAVEETLDRSGDLPDILLVLSAQNTNFLAGFIMSCCIRHFELVIN